MNKQTPSTSGGLGFVGALTIVFITLKLLKIIDWPWHWVLSPIWISAAVIAVIFLIGALWIFGKYKHDKGGD